MNEKLYQQLLDDVIAEIVSDVNYGDYSAIECLITKVNVSELIQFLPEEMWDKYNF